MTIRAILFDIDGTLVDSNGLHVDAWQRALKDHGHHVGRNEIAQQIGKGADQLLPALVRGIAAEQIEVFGKRHDEHFRRDGLPNVRPFSKAREVIQHATERGLMVVLASSANQRDIDYYLDLLDVRGIVHCTTSADDVASSKPAPDIFSASLRKLDGIAANETVVVGDTPYDVEAALRCGIRTVAVRSGGFTDATLLAAGAFVIVDDVRELLIRFDELFLKS